jgi:hypothetical protein
MAPNAGEGRGGRPRVVILGGRFAGVGAARRSRDVDVDEDRAKTGRISVKPDELERSAV